MTWIFDRISGFTGCWCGFLQCKKVGWAAPLCQSIINHFKQFAMKKHCLFFLLLALTSLPICAQWTRLNQPAIHAIQDAVGNGDTLAIKNGFLQPRLYLSYDGGENWKDISNPTYNNHYMSAIRNGKIFALNAKEGVAVHENGQWFTRNNGLQRYNTDLGYLTYTFDLHPDWALASSVKNGLNWLYLSKDEGLNWTPVSSLGLNPGYSALYGRFVGDRIYSWGVNEQQGNKPEAYYSDNFGQNWSSLPVSGPAGSTSVLVIGANHVFVKQADGWYLHEGNTFIKVADLPNGVSLPDGIVEDGGYLLAATGTSILRSSDGGRSWSEVPQAPTGIYEIVKYGSQLVAITVDQFCASNDYGATWQTQPLAYKFFRLFVSGNQLYGTTYGQEGIYRFDSATQQWRAKNKDIQKVSESFTHLVSDGAKAWAFSSILGFSFFTEDAGQTWQEADRYSNSITPKVNGKYYASDFNAIIQSSDGKNWSNAPWLTNTPLDISQLFSNGNDLFAITYSDQLLRSEGGATPWDTINSAMPPGILRIIANGPTWHLATNEGIYRSDDEGKTWTKIGTFTNPTALLWSGDRILAGLRNGSVRYRDPSFTIWKTGSGTLTTKFGPYGGNGLTAIGNVLIATGQGGKILTSINNGATWTLFNTGLTASSNCSETIAIGDRLYAACEDGLWARPLSDLPAVIATTEPPIVDLYAPMPNPTTGLLQFQNVPTGTTLDVQVNDANGRTVFSGDLAKAGYALDLSGQPQGVYFIRVFDGERTGVSRVVVW